jgi:hypothetical protein
MAQNRSRQRSHRAPIVEAQLDPNWQNPYAPSPDEIASNEAALAEHFQFRFLAGLSVLGSGVLCLIASVALPALAIVGIIALVAGLGLLAQRAVSMTTWRRDSFALADKIVARFSPVPNPAFRQRIGTIAERLGATFGLADVSCFIVDEDCVNATFLPHGEAGTWALIVTRGLLEHIELIDLEGVVAHCMARVRLRVTDRRAIAAVSKTKPDIARRLAGPGLSYRADEVAAAAIRYPVGIARALEYCSAHRAQSGYFASAEYDAERWIWFDQYADGSESPSGDLDRADVRASALLEW